MMLMFKGGSLIGTEIVRLVRSASSPNYAVSSRLSKLCPLKSTLVKNIFSFYLHILCNIKKIILHLKYFFQIFAQVSLI